MDNRSADTRLTDPVTTPFDDIRIAQQHYDRTENVETLPATSQKTRSPWLFRLATAHNPRFYPARRLATSPVLIPLGVRPIQNLARKKTLPPLAGDGGRRREGGNTKPGFIPLGTLPFRQTQCLPRLAAATSPGFIPLGTR